MRQKFDPAALSRKPKVPDGHVRYVYEEGLVLAVNVALAAGRPLLLRGAPGSGKTTLAKDVAWLLGRRYDPEVVTSKTQAQDLEWGFDAVRRLADAQGRENSRNRAQETDPYVKPGVLWRAFDPKDARAHGARIGRREPGGAVVLLDEIDKADPDVPNDLLMVLDQGWFDVTDIPGKRVSRKDVEVFVVITTNGERELTPAFIRRCITYDIPELSDTLLKDIGRRHFPGVDESLLAEAIALLRELAKRAAKDRLRAPSTAEMVDALRACRELRIATADSPEWRKVTETAMWKHPPAPPVPKPAGTA